MSPEKQRVAIAEACGWKPETRPMYAGEKKVKGWGKNAHLHPGHIERQFIPGWAVNSFPDYLSDLNAIVSAVQAFRTSNQFFFYEYQQHLFAVTCEGFGEDSLYRYSLCQFECVNATAAQRAKALLLTLGRWEFPPTPKQEAGK
jgi:hypothetical protein